MQCEDEHGAGGWFGDDTDQQTSQCSCARRQRVLRCFAPHRARSSKQGSMVTRFSWCSHLHAQAKCPGECWVSALLLHPPCMRHAFDPSHVAQGRDHAGPPPRGALRRQPTASRHPPAHLRAPRHAPRAARGHCAAAGCAGGQARGQPDCAAANQDGLRGGESRVGARTPGGSNAKHSSGIRPRPSPLVGRSRQLQSTRSCAAPAAMNKHPHAA